MKISSLKNVLGDKCRIVNTKSGLYFNGYDDYTKSSKGKNTLSENNFKSFMSFNKDDDEIIQSALKDHITIKSDGVEYIQNVIVYKGSVIHEILSKYYSEYDYLPLSDFKIEKL